MDTFSEHDYIKSYELGNEALKTDPHNRDIQYRLVISLARLGALDFALAEYTRLGLDQVTDNEDIMALAGRLTKDLYLRNTGTKAAGYAQDSAAKYDAAFQATKGYFSGINAATMALMADMAEATVTARAKAIIAILPSIENLTATDHYFVEATRAEALLLCGDEANAKMTLKAAMAFDPLNYTAHATTLKQFRMILSKRGLDQHWLLSLSPPCPIHYAGHINLALPGAGEDSLSWTVTDYLQRHDVGSGYGALAAGSDIIFAEALLAEGADLHVILPCDEARFFESSVLPFGPKWTARYSECLKRASSVTMAAKNAPWPDPRVNRFAGQFAMGQASLRASSFGVSAMQFMIWDQKEGASYTALHVSDWAETKKQQVIIPIQASAQGTKVSRETVGQFPFLLKWAEQEGIKKHETIEEVMSAALTAYRQNNNARLALHVEIPGENFEDILQKILHHSAPESILMSEAFASLLAHFAAEQFDISFAGLIPIGDDTDLRCYVLNAAP